MHSLPPLSLRSNSLDLTFQACAAFAGSPLPRGPQSTSPDDQHDDMGTARGIACAVALALAVYAIGLRLVAG